MVSQCRVKIDTVASPSCRYDRDYPAPEGFGEHGRDFDYDSQQCGSRITSMALHFEPDSDNEG